MEEKNRIDLEPSYYNWLCADKRWAKYLAVWTDKPYFQLFFFYGGHCDMAGDGRNFVIDCILCHQSCWNGTWTDLMIWFSSSGLGFLYFGLLEYIEYMYISYM